MSADLEPLLAVLEGATEPVDCFIRDDDGGWDNERQIAQPVDAPWDAVR